MCRLPAKLFQSRNRGSCRFKFNVVGIARDSDVSFNLVIEVLVVSSILSCQRYQRG